jgi:transcriptional regulator with XRE-family HTH domain
MSSGKESEFAAYARLLRSWRNECKLPVALVAERTGITARRLEELERGAVEPHWNELERLAEVYSVSVRDLLPRRDDRDNGIKILRGSDSNAIIQHRAGRHQYTYFERACSSVLPDFRPVELLLHLTDPDSVVLNHGHFFHQYTQVLEGEVGFLWRWEGQVYKEVLVPGDSWLIPGFVPHGFYSTNSDRLGRLLAITFGCHLTGDAREEAAVIGGEYLERIIRSPDYYDK